MLLKRLDSQLQNCATGRETSAVIGRCNSPIYRDDIRQCRQQFESLPVSIAELQYVDGLLGCRRS